MPKRTAEQYPAEATKKACSKNSGTRFLKGSQYYLEITNRQMNQISALPEEDLVLLRLFDKLLSQMQDYADQSKQIRLRQEEKKKENPIEPSSRIQLIDMLNTKAELDVKIDKCYDLVDHLFQDFGILYKIYEFLNDNEFVKFE